MGSVVWVVEMVEVVFGLLPEFKRPTQSPRIGYGGWGSGPVTFYYPSKIQEM